MQSLKNLPGAAIRLEDGGEKAKNPQIGDFLYFTSDGHAWLFECKATKKTAFPLGQLRPGQAERLAKMDALPRVHACMAINFWDECGRNDCAIVPWRDYAAMVEKAAEQKRASIPFSWLEPYLQEKGTGACKWLWHLNLVAL